MAAAESSVTHADDITTCSICFETFTEPKALPCLHTYCLKCLNTCCEDKKQAKCPDCKKGFKIPQGGIKNLLTNFFVQQMIDLQNTNKRIKLSSDYCDQHPGEENLLYCHDCKAVMCPKCVSKHKQHYIDNVSEAAEEFRELLKQDLIQLSNKKENSSKQSESDKKEFIGKVELTQSKISEEYDQLISLLNLRQRKLMARLNSLKVEKLDSEKEQEGDNNTQRIACDILQKEFQEIISKGSAYDMCRKTPALHSRAGELLQTQDDKEYQALSAFEIFFKPSNFSPACVKNLLGNIGLTNNNTKKTTIFSFTPKPVISIGQDSDDEPTSTLTGH